MSRTRWTFALLAAGFVTFALAAAWSPSVEAHDRGVVTCRPYEYGRADLFYNFYVPPTCGGVGAQLYPAPLPVPYHVGHVYHTYQPLMPHEFLYKHHRSYHRYYDEGRGLTRTSVTWW